MKIRKYGDSVLREKSVAVEKIDNSVKALMNDMTLTMYNNEGIGISAPQVGVNKRIIVVDTGEGLIEMVNPEILEKRGEEKSVEGCLSLPGIEVEVRRAKEIKVKGLNREGKAVKPELKGLEARAVQHEIDHLEGILIVDYMSIVKKHLTRKLV